MSFFDYYIKKRILTFITLFFVFAVFLFSFFLYSLPMTAVAYPFGVCVVIFTVVIIFDIRREKKKYENIQIFKDLPDINKGDIKEYISDEMFCELLFLLCEQKEEQAGENTEKFNETVEYYTAWVHQIKTPIASMRLKLQNEDTSFSRSINGDLFRIEQYVEMVMTYLRLDSYSTDYVIRHYDLDMIIKKTVKKYASDFINKKISLDYSEVNKSVLTDEKWFVFVLEQILSNSLKYTEAGKISICCEDGFLCISDTGIGIAEQDLPRVFEKGYTGLNGREDKKSSGLGLYLVGRICKNLNHKIMIESEVGKGTAVKIEINKKNIEIE